MTVSASICSVMRMMPISAVRAEPARPVTMRAASTGPSSRMIESATAGPRNASEPKRAERQVDLQAEDHPGEGAGQEDDQQRAEADVVDAAQERADSLKGGVTVALSASPRKVPKRPSDSTIAMAQPPERLEGAQRRRERRLSHACARR